MIIGGGRGAGREGKPFFSLSYKDFIFSYILRRFCVFSISSSNILRMLFGYKSTFQKILNDFGIFY